VLKQQEDGVSLVFEPTTTMQVLRGCKHCGAIHPLAMRPPVYTSECPKCQNPLASLEPPQSADGYLTGGIAGVIANACLGIGRKLRNLAKDL
jgi:hypothetical protein